MSLTDVMSHAGYAGYAITAMILFLIVFVGAVIWIFAPWRKRELDEESRLPLEDDEGPAGGKGADR